MPIPGPPEPPGPLPDPPPVPMPPVPIEEPTPEPPPPEPEEPITPVPVGPPLPGPDVPLPPLSRARPSAPSTATSWAAAEVDHAAVLRRLSPARLSRRRPYARSIRWRARCSGARRDGCTAVMCKRCCSIRTSSRRSSLSAAKISSFASSMICTPTTCQSNARSRIEVP